MNLPFTRRLLGGKFLLGGMFFAGLAIALVMAARCQVSGDQLNLYARGWILISQHEVVPYGLPTSAGGKSPGSLTSLLVGLPLMAWRDYRAPVLLTLLFHVLAYFLLDRLLARTAGRRERVLFALFYWLNPWQLYFAGYLWNANWVGLLGAVHTFTAWRLRERPAFWASCLHCLSIGICAQLHSSFVILCLATLLLWTTRQIRLNLAGAALAVALVFFSVLPWAMAVLENPGLLPGGSGRVLGRGLVAKGSLLGGVWYLLRYPSLLFAGRMTAFDFSPALGPGADALLAPLFKAGALVAGVLSLAVPILAHRRLWPRFVRRFHWRSDRPLSGRAWLTGYTATTLAAALAACALSPTTFMLWQGFVILHVAVFPVVLYLALLLRTHRRRPCVRRWLAAHAAASLVILLAMAFAAPMYRQGGRMPRAITLRADHPMLHELGIAPRCTVPVRPAGGWWPDALPPP